MKVQVLARSFYEDAYLPFFIQYYLDLGFDRIVIFKADKDELGPLSLDFLKSNEERQRVVIKYVVNEGNNIYTNPNNFIYYKDTNYDWSLHVDIDEFLVINREKYKRIHDYIIDLHKIMDVPLNEIYNIKFRWLCINKLNDNWYSNKIINNELLLKETLTLFNTETLTNTHTLDITHLSGSYYDYVIKNKLEIYSFIKGMYKTDKLLDNCKKMDAHVIMFKEGLNMNNRIVIDNTFTTVNKYKSPLFGSNSSPEKNYCNGFILHFNTRSYSNSLTKCLVTQLRDNKKIKDLSGFVKFINNIDDKVIKSINNRYDNNRLIDNWLIDNNTNNDCISDEKAGLLRDKYRDFLNSKAFFPRKIATFNAKYEYLITKENYLQQIRSVINANKNLIVYKPFINLNREIEILEQLCEIHSINYNKLKVILKLFNDN
jgi:hypothetical protein